ncbi:uncharacterized protein FIBRA_07380 [Fibroporia radiculosa]|uniref:Endonuclease/exonuclease/phosphatase domain-containing protein n=1 Tax=Fibroporia radiculosa TaxID=599839 RepID=J4IBS5_9APHY|nr:uncharacterized protein FIBRA_07380 [Fibroporia radiculosa]CCM05171.1 predicted protein [Fibroporia radiculosa]
MPEEFQPTSDRLALAEERRLRKEKRMRDIAKELDESGRILPREWITLQEAPISDKTVGGVKVMTWNLLAQCLAASSSRLVTVSRQANENICFIAKFCRMTQIYAAYRNAIYCFLNGDRSSELIQEVDRLEKLLPVLEKSGYAWVYASGRRKKHGCLIAFRKDAYTLLEEKVVYYDEQDVRPDGTERAQRGGSFWTKNIASMVRLQRNGLQSNGVIVATTHLFWHPSYTYERARQAAILMREVTKFKASGSYGTQDWPCIIAGDFNFSPDDPAYSLIVGDTLLPIQDARLAASRVVHVTIDPEVSTVPNANPAEDEADVGGETDPDRVITNARSAMPADGLLSSTELVDMFRQSGTPNSVYDTGSRTCPSLAEDGFAYGNREPVSPGKLGAYEPVWTSYTHYWKTVLDYIFVLPPHNHEMVVTKIAKPHRTEALQPGIPRKGVCGSDHISLGAELFWTAST